MLIGPQRFVDVKPIAADSLIGVFYLLYRVVSDTEYRKQVLTLEPKSLHALYPRLTIMWEIAEYSESMISVATVVLSILNLGTFQGYLTDYVPETDYRFSVPLVLWVSLCTSGLSLVSKFYAGFKMRYDERKRNKVEDAPLL